MGNYNGFNMMEVNPLDKVVLVHYCEMKEEIKDIRRRIRELDKYLENPPIVSDTVKGTRRDGTFGPIKITGIPDPQYRRKQVLLERYRMKLKLKEAELLELMCQAEEYVDTVEKPEMRMILRLSIIDGMTNIKVAECMNHVFPKRKIKYTDENIKKRIQRFFENVPQCPLETC